MHHASKLLVSVATVVLLGPKNRSPRQSMSVRIYPGWLVNLLRSFKFVSHPLRPTLSFSARVCVRLCPSLCGAIKWLHHHPGTKRVVNPPFVSFSSHHSRTCVPQVISFPFPFLLDRNGKDIVSGGQSFNVFRRHKVRRRVTPPKNTRSREFYFDRRKLKARRRRRMMMMW